MNRIGIHKYDINGIIVKMSHYTPLKTFHWFVPAVYLGFSTRDSTTHTHTIYSLYSIFLFC